MNILETLTAIGPEHIRFQTIHESMTNGKVGKKQSTITFATNTEHVSSLNKTLALGGKVKTIGLVLWIDADTWEKTVKKS